MKKKSVCNKIILTQNIMADYVWKALLTEFLGTAILVMIGAGAVALTVAEGGSVVGAAFAFGLVFMSLIYTWGSYSGAHFNPAVSFGFAVAGRMNWLLMLGYWVAQLLGGIVGAALVLYFYGTDTGVGASVGSLTNTDAWAAVLLEAILTFILVTTVLFVTRNPMLAVISGLAIGLVLTFAYLAAGPLTGASMNPARSLGPAIFSNNMGSYWIYVVGPLLGALVAALVYKLFTIDWNCCDAVDECGNPILDECCNQLKICTRPVLDNCGRQVCGPCGEGLTEEYFKHERLFTHHQETPLGYIGEWMTSHGIAPGYIKQEFEHAVAGVAPNGVIANPEAVVQQVVQPVASAVPGIATRPAMGAYIAQPVLTQPALAQPFMVPQTGYQTGYQTYGPNTGSAFGQGLNSIGQGLGQTLGGIGQTVTAPLAPLANQPF